jgi:hypothetical protein
MSTFSRALGSRSPLRTAAAVVALAWIAVLAAFAYSAVSVTTSTGSLVAAAAALLIAAAAILYAWREPGR